MQEEYKWFESLDEILEHDNEESCYVAYEGMVFDVTETLGDLEMISLEDCGGEILLSEDEWVAAYEKMVSGYLGAIRTEFDFEEDVVLEDGELSFVENQPSEIVEVEEVDEPFLQAETVVMLGVGLLIIIVVGAILFTSMKKEK